MKYSSIFSMLSFFILVACNETAVYGSDENIIFMRYVEKLHLDKYSVKNTVKTETMAIQLAEIYVRYRYGERIAEEEKPYLITELPDSWVVEGAKLPYEVAEPVLRSVAGAVYHSGPDRAGGGMESVCVSAESGEWY